MRRTIPYLLILLILLPFKLRAEVKEPKTGVGFPETITHEGTELILAGVGVRTKLVVKVYAAALYLEGASKSALSQHKSQSAKPNQAVYDAVADGSFGKLFILHFVRDVDSGKIVEAFRDGLDKSIDLNAAEVKADAKAFLSASQIDMKEGQQLKIFLKGDEVTVISPTATSSPIKNAKVAAAVARIWLGKEPISDDLKKGLVNRLPQLLEG